MALYKDKTLVADIDDTRQGLLDGVTEVSRVVCSTLGGCGRPVVISRENGLPPVVTKDGVTVARSLRFKDGLISTMASRLVVDASLRTNREAGDGTTTTVAMIDSILRAINKIEKNRDINFRREDFELITKRVIEALPKKSKFIKDNNDIYNIAKISSNDVEIASRIAEAYKLVGNNGLVTTKLSLNDLEEIIFKRGITLDKGFVNPLFKPEGRDFITVDSPIVTVIKEHIEDFSKLQGILHSAVNMQKDLVIFAPTFSKAGIIETVLRELYCKTEDRTIPINIHLLVGSGFGKRQLDILDDIATVFQINAFDNIKYEKLTSEFCVLADGFKFNIYLDKVFIDIPEDYDTSENPRITQLTEQLKNEVSYHEKEKLEERISILKGCQATITYHAKSEAEAEEIRDRIDDALCSVKAGLTEGFVIGGSRALNFVAGDIFSSENGEDMYIEFIDYVQTNLLNLLLENVHRINCLDTVKKYLAKQNIIDTLKESDDKTVYDVRNEDFVDAEECGIIDATKVFRVAFENAMSVASVIHLSGFSIFPEIKE